MSQLSDQELKLIYHHGPLYMRTLFSDDSPLCRQHEGLNRSHIQAIVFLKMHGRAMMSALAAFLGLEKGSFTPVANRLLDWGYVEKVADPADKRKGFLQLTPAGHDFAQELEVDRIRIFEERLACLSRGERRAFFQHLDSLQELLIRMQGSQATTFAAHLTRPDGRP